MKFIVELECSGTQHLIFNWKFLYFYQMTVSDQIVFYSEIEHWKQIKLKFDVNISHKKIKNSENKVINEIFKAINILKIFFHSNFETKIIFLSVNTPSLLLIKLLNILFKRNIYVQIHGVLENLNDYKNNYISKIFSFKSIFLNKNNIKLKYIIIDEGVHQRLINEYPAMSNYTILMQAPYDFKLDTSYKKDSSGFINISGAGVATCYKYSHLIFKLAKHFENRNLKFRHVGTVLDKNLYTHDNSLVSFKNYKVNFSDAEYTELISKTDYIVIFYPSESYKFTLSGIYLDCIRYEIPVITIKNYASSYLFSKYNIGWECESLEDIINVIELISNGEINISFKDTFKKFKKDYSDDFFINQMSKLD